MSKLPQREGGGLLNALFSSTSLRTKTSINFPVGRGRGEGRGAPPLFQPGSHPRGSSSSKGAHPTHLRFLIETEFVFTLLFRGGRARGPRSYPPIFPAALNGASGFFSAPPPPTPLVLYFRTDTPPLQVMNAHPQPHFKEPGEALRLHFRGHSPPVASRGLRPRVCLQFPEAAHTHA